MFVLVHSFIQSINLKSEAGYSTIAFSISNCRIKSPRCYNILKGIRNCSSLSCYLSCNWLLLLDIGYVFLGNHSKYNNSAKLERQLHPSKAHNTAKVQGNEHKIGTKDSGKNKQELIVYGIQCCGPPR